jgi:N-methylhydantoinase A/oxoprolinase/acetone carboxylase beta subunit
MKYKVIACGVLEHELKAAAQTVGAEVELEVLSAGLHARPRDLRRQIQAVLDATRPEDGFDAVCLAYGLCGRGTAELVARHVPVVIPRGHDCLTLLLGSAAAYHAQFTRQPGTFYVTRGWFERKVRPATQDVHENLPVGPRSSEAASGKAEEGGDSTERIADRRERSQTPPQPTEARAGSHARPQEEAVDYLADYRDDRRIASHPHFARFAASFGEENARYIIAFHESWKTNYRRAAYIDTGVGDGGAEAFTQALAESLGWEYERIDGSLTFFERMLAGDWDEGVFLVLAPGQRSIASGDGRVLAAVDTNAPAAEMLTGETNDAPPEPVRFDHRVVGLGIDAGGTYTDAVIYDFSAEAVLAKAKALTTPRDYSRGIVAAVRKLPAELAAEVNLVSLSTTLATNAVVEGRGGRVGTLLMVQRADLADGLPVAPAAVIPGVMDIEGAPTAAPDRDATLAAARDMIARHDVAAFAVSGYGATANPAHELQVAQWIRDELNLPVVCGHALTGKLNFRTRAVTAALNARLLPTIRRLLDSVKSALAALAIDAPLMVVKGDGTLVAERVARSRPIETILSGPAASVAGARFLTDLPSAVVIDVGGTTTDLAVLSDGFADLSVEGARVGGWRTSIEAARIETVGLGGDSQVSFDRERRLQIGPRRVVPVSMLAAEHPRVHEQLDRLAGADDLDRTNSACLEFYFRLADAEGRLEEQEKRILAALADGPLSRLALTAAANVPLASLLRARRLVQIGAVGVSALTPTDALHCLCLYEEYDKAAAKKTMAIFAELLGEPAGELAARIREEVSRRVATHIAAVALARQERGEAGVFETPTASALLETAMIGHDTAELMEVRLHCRRPIVAIGAPVAAYLPRAAELLHAELLIPEHADVANAVGAIAADVVLRERVVIRPDTGGGYLVLGRGRQSILDLSEAVAYAEAECRRRLRAAAEEAGTRIRDVRIRRHEQRGLSSHGDRILIEVRVEAAAIGKPVVPSPRGVRGPGA